MPAKMTIANMQKGARKGGVRYDIQYGSFTNFENAANVCDNDYLTARKIARIFGMDLKKFNRLGVIEHVDYIVCRNRSRAYLWKQVVVEMYRRGFGMPRMDHPTAEVNVESLVADTGVDVKNFYKQIEMGRITPHRKPGSSLQYVYMGEYDKFLREYFLPDSLRWVGSQPLGSAEMAIFCGYKSADAVRRALARGMMPTHRPQTKTARLKFTKADIAQWLANCRKTFRREPLPDALPTKLAAMYMRRSVWQFGKITKFLKVVPGKPGYYTRDSMDAWYMKEWCMKAYGEHSCYYTIPQICAKFNRTRGWVDEYIVGKCDVYTTGRNVLTNEQFRHDYAGKPEQYPFIYGYHKKAVEAIVASSPELHTIPEIEDTGVGIRRRPKGIAQLTVMKDSKIRSHISRGVKRQLAMAAKERPQDDVEYGQDKPLAIGPSMFELGLRAALRRTEFERDAKMRETRLKMKKTANNDNRLREILGIKKKEMQVRPKDMLRLSLAPVNVYMVHTLGYTKGLFTDRLPEKSGFVVKSPAQFLPVKSTKERPNSFSLVSNLYDKVQAMKPGTPPAWYVLVGGNTVIGDMRFPEKLAEVPDGIAAVGAFGYERFLPNGSWVDSPASYGIYGTFDKNVSNNEWVMGKKGVNGSHRVAVLDGPFIAVRGLYSDILSDLRQFSPMIDGDSGQTLMSAVISLILGRLGLPMMQIPVDCSMCREQPIKVGTLEWNRLEDLLIKFYRHK